MLSLHEFQNRFADAIWSGEESLLPLIRAHHLKAASRMDIYRNNVLAGLAAALQGGFPVVERLVGPAFFDVLARDFVRAHPPQDPCLFEYGQAFPAYIDAYPAAAGLPYLPDVARLG